MDLPIDVQTFCAVLTFTFLLIFTIYFCGIALKTYKQNNKIKRDHENNDYFLKALLKIEKKRIEEGTAKKPQKKVDYYADVRQAIADQLIKYRLQNGLSRHKMRRKVLQVHSTTYIKLESGLWVNEEITRKVLNFLDDQSRPYEFSIQNIQRAFNEPGQNGK